MNEVASITANDGLHADATLVRRFRHAQTKRERAALFEGVVRLHRRPLLCFCAEVLWPDADAAVAAAGRALVTARLAIADSAKLPDPDLLRGWLLAIAAQSCAMPGLPADIDDIDWAAVHARVAADVPERPVSSDELASLRHWLEQIVATLPEPRQRMYDLFVARGLDSRSAALELGTGVAEVRRLRRENRQAVLRAFEVTALAAAEAPLDEPRGKAPGCGELRQIMAAQQDGDPHEGRAGFVVLPAALRVNLSRHLSQCTTCQDRRDECMASWGPELLPIMADAELYEQVMDDLRSMFEPGQRGSAHGAHRRVPRARTVVVRRAAATGAGLLVALPLLAFVWPGFLNGAQGSAALSPQGFSSSRPSSIVAPQTAGTTGGAAAATHGQPVHSAASGVLSRLSPQAPGSTAAPATSLPPSVFYTVPPSPSPTPSLTSGTPATTPSPSPSASSPKPKKPSPTPSPVKSTKPPSPAPSTTSPAPSVAPSTTPSTTPSSPAPSSPAPTTSAAATVPSSASAAPTANPSTPSPTGSATA